MLLEYELLNRIARVWRRRQRTEREAASLFSGLADDLEAIGADASMVYAARQASEDEARHADRCAALATRFDPTVVALPDIARPPLGPTTLGPARRALYTSVALSCVTETLSTALLEYMRTRARDEHVHATVRDILRDEVAHARIGWAYLATASRGGPVGWLATHLPGMLRATIRSEVAAPDDVGQCASDLSGFGILDPADVRRVLKSVADDVLFPGLENFGVDSAPAREELARMLAPRAAAKSEGFPSAERSIARTNTTSV